MSSKIIYTPFISKSIPKSKANEPIPISFPISEYQGVNPNREVIPINYTFTEPKKQKETVTVWSPDLEGSREMLKKRNGSHQFKYNNIDVGNMQGFLDEAAKNGIYFRVTSGVRKGAVTSKGNKSNHDTGDAIDITPLDGQSWEELITQIKNSPELLDYMKKHKMRILDERTPDILAQTGGTGAHFHLSFGRTEGKSIDEYFA